jgi:hypothetical protein
MIYYKKFIINHGFCIFSKLNFAESVKKPFPERTFDALGEI